MPGFTYFPSTGLRAELGETLEVAVFSSPSPAWWAGDNLFLLLSLPAVSRGRQGHVLGNSLCSPALTRQEFSVHPVSLPLLCCRPPKFTGQRSHVLQRFSSPFLLYAASGVQPPWAWVRPVGLEVYVAALLPHTSLWCALDLSPAIVVHPPVYTCPLNTGFSSLVCPAGIEGVTLWVIEEWLILFGV